MASFPAASLSIPSSPRKCRAAKLNSLRLRTRLCWQGPLLWLSVYLCNGLWKRSFMPPAYHSRHPSIPTSRAKDTHLALSLSNEAAATKPCISLGLRWVYQLILHTESRRIAKHQNLLNQWATTARLVLTASPTRLYPQHQQVFKKSLKHFPCRFAGREELSAFHVGRSSTWPSVSPHFIPALSLAQPLRGQAQGSSEGT